jgi:hypothetical protein
MAGTLIFLSGNVSPTSTYNRVSVSERVNKMTTMSHLDLLPLCHQYVNQPVTITLTDGYVYHGVIQTIHADGITFQPFQPATTGTHAHTSWFFPFFIPLALLAALTPFFFFGWW